MTINVKASLQDLINQAYAENKSFSSISFVSRLITSELETAAKQADAVLNKTLENTAHNRAYRAILEYALERYTLTETIGLMGNVILDDHHDIVENNLRLLAETVASYDNTWNFFKKGNIVSTVDDILKSEDPTTEPNRVETLVTNQ